MHAFGWVTQSSTGAAHIVGFALRFCVLGNNKTKQFSYIEQLCSPVPMTSVALQEPALSNEIWDSKNRKLFISSHNCIAQTVCRIMA